MPDGSAPHRLRLHESIADIAPEAWDACAGGDNPFVSHAFLLARGLIDPAFRGGVSSLHVTFAREEEWQRLGAFGFLQRTGYQFHWSNRGYASFDDFLNDLSSRKRKSIRKERRDCAESGVV